MDIRSTGNRSIITVIMLVWAVICIAGAAFYVGDNRAEASYSATLTEDYVYLRKSPAGDKVQYNGSDLLLRKGQSMTVTSTSNKSWYKVKLTYKSKSYTGYVYSKYIKAAATTTTTATLTEDYVYFRKTAAGTPITVGGSAILLRKGQKMTVLSTSNKTWYKVKLTYNGKAYSGYVYAAYLKLTKTTTQPASTATTTQATTQAATTYKTGKINTDYVYFRKTAGGTPLTHGGSTIFLMKGQALTILSTANSSWYKVKLTYSGTSYTGYVSAPLVTIDSANNNAGSTTTSDAAFEKLLTSQGFPDSYKVLLRRLHKAHPNWVFKAVNTGLDWNDVVENEVNVKGRVNNLVNCTTDSPKYGWRSQTVGYNFKTDTYSSYDGATWFAASDELVEYYLDPRNYLASSVSVFAFEKLSYDSSQTRSGVEAILYGSFMYQSRPSGSSSTYSSLIISAAKKSGVSPYHIASRIKQEVGNSLSSGTNGKNKTYPGIYNFYNIGAFESPEGNAITNGLKWASTGTTYNRPWTSAAKSIIGGATYIGESYINKGQNTLYTQKFNVTYTDCLYWHQYMGNVQAPATEAIKVYQAYKSSGALDKAITFAIPVYKNMPASRVSRPGTGTGSQNAYLSSLTVGSYKLSPTFSISNTTSYSLNVGSSVSSVTIAATAVSSGSTITGTGKKTLKKGKNTFKIVCKSQGKKTRTYTITINRG